MAEQKSFGTIAFSAKMYDAEGVEDYVSEHGGSGSSTPSDDEPLMDGSPSAGSSDSYARGDHVHPTDTTRASVVDATLNGRGYGAWTVTPDTVEIVREYDTAHGDPKWVLYPYQGGGPIGLPIDDTGQTTVAWTVGDSASIDVIATRTALPGYILGSQTGKPIASVDHSHASLSSGDTIVSAVPGGMVSVTLMDGGLGNASVVFADGFSVQYGEDTPYVAPSGGETIEFTGPVEIEHEGGPTYNYWLPEGVDPEGFNPSFQEMWCLYSLSEIPEYLMWKTGVTYAIGSWNTVSQTLSLTNGEAEGVSPTMSRPRIPSTAYLVSSDAFDALVARVAALEARVNQ